MRNVRSEPARCGGYLLRLFEVVLQSDKAADINQVSSIIIVSICIIFSINKSRLDKSLNISALVRNILIVKK